ncbi:MAG: hypothetical protein ACPHYC_02115 [Schleiferiaceae bacterium]
MSTEMFAVGAVLFALYIYFTAWNIIHNNKRQDEERKALEDNSSVDELDSDGMGNFSRFPQEKD